MARWLLALVLSANGAGCYCSHARELDGGALDAGAHDAAGIDAAVERFEGCDDPRLWEVAALEAVGDVELGGGPCLPAQYPATGASISAQRPPAFPIAELPRLARSCWRVTASHPQSGWAVGQVLASDRAHLELGVIGHERPVTLEGRVMRDDGVVRLALRDVVVALDVPWVLDEDLTELVALGMTGETLARARSVTLRGAAQPTEGTVVAATASRAHRLIWLERVGTELFLRAVDRGLAAVFRSISLGSPVEAYLAPRGAVVVLDRRELVFAEDDLGAVHRVALDDEVESIVAGWPAVVVQMDGELIAFGEGGVEQSRLAVGGGTLLPGPADGYHPPYFWDGTRVVAIDATEALAFDESRSTELSPGDVAITGELIAVGHGVLIGREGFVHWPVRGPVPPGPRAVGARELHGGPITHVAADTTSYVVTRADGAATLYRVPFTDFCE